MRLWAKVCLGSVLQRSTEVVSIDPKKVYKEITVKLWGKGVIERGKISGSELPDSRRFIAHTNQLIVSRIDARNGAFGLVPHFLEGAIVTNDFPLFVIDENRMLPAFIGWLVKTKAFVDLCRHVSEGTTNRVRLKEAGFLSLDIQLPSIPEQHRIVTQIEKLFSKLSTIEKLSAEIMQEQQAFLRAVFNSLVSDASHFKMAEVAPLVRRAVKIDPEKNYPELGIRSFGKGTFHKPEISGVSLGSKRLYSILPGDIVFNNVFAWEGAVAVSQQEDSGRFGSHRFITCVPDEKKATAQFLCFYFLTPEGLTKLGEASPGGAGRNRTLGLDALSKITVPVPSLKKQLWFDKLQSKVLSIQKRKHEESLFVSALLPSVLDRAFKGAL